jgi:RHS repeat-associated protein
LTNKIGTGGAPNVPIGVNPTNNQITDGAPQYDANGNLTAQTGVSYTYDAENRMTNFGSVNNGARTFAYDSQNKRILNWTGSTDQNGNASGYTVYYYGVKGERLGVYNFTVGYWAGGTTPTLENSTTSTETFFGARRLAPLDRLGSARSVNNTASSYYPFGEDKSTNPAIDAWKFGTYWRESASGLDYADQRFYSSTLGRFLTPDLFGGSEAGLNPQSWNRYSYSLNDPVNYFDPTGKNAVCVTKVDEGDDDSSTECFGGDGSSGSGSGSGGASPVQPRKTRLLTI